MADIPIGFDRTLRRTWMDEAARLVRSGPTPLEARRALGAFLEMELRGAAARDKVLAVLGRVWITPRGYVQTLHGAALDHWPMLGQRSRLALHWGLTIAAHPFFREFAAQVGRVARLQEQFTARQIHARMRERFGDRDVVHRAGQHAMATLVDWGAVRAVPGKGVYRTAPPVPIEDPSVGAWLVEAEVAGSGRQMQPWSDALSAPSLFAFSLPADGDLRSGGPGRLQYSQQAGDETMVSIINHP